MGHKYVNTMSTLYAAMGSIEQERYGADKLYSLILDVSQKDELKALCTQFVNKLRTLYPNRSTRLERILDEMTTTDDRIALHGFLFFCLRKHDWAIKEVFKDSSSPPEKISMFIMQILPQLTDKLLRGSFTSLRLYVEDARSQYIML